MSSNDEDTDPNCLYMVAAFDPAGNDIMPVRYIPQENQYGDFVKEPRPDKHGLWWDWSESHDYALSDSTVRPAIEHPDSFNFLEVHKSFAWECNPDRDLKLAVFRIGLYVSEHRLQIGDCVLLDKTQLTEVRDRINAMLEEM